MFFHFLRSAYIAQHFVSRFCMISVHIFLKLDLVDLEQMRIEMALVSRFVVAIFIELFAIEWDKVAVHERVAPQKLKMKETNERLPSRITKWEKQTCMDLSCSLQTLQV
jgi:hypothetical protein